MCAAAVVPAPLSAEGLTFWEDLVSQCNRYAAATNRVISARGLVSNQLLATNSGGEFHICKSAPPSTSVRLSIAFLPWGPVVRGRASGREEHSEFCLEEWEVPIAKDLDGTVVAIFDEGRSFSPEDLARYVIQRFRRWYPDVSFPYDDCRREIN